MKGCSACKIVKADSEFYVDGKTGRLSSRCKECVRKYARKYNRSRSKREKRAKRRREKDYLQNRLLEVLAESKCMDCGEDDPVVLVFHHRDPDEKESGISRMISDRIGWSRIEKELEKCDCLCANCHFRRHHEMGDYREYLRS